MITGRSITGAIFLSARGRPWHGGRYEIKDHGNRRVPTLRGATLRKLALKLLCKSLVPHLGLTRSEDVWIKERQHMFNYTTWSGTEV
jgi:hypothetical protein